MIDFRSLPHCAGKEAFDDAGRARAVLARMPGRRQVKHDGHSKLVVYECRHCAKWHIGTMAR